MGIFLTILPILPVLKNDEDMRGTVWFIHIKTVITYPGGVFQKHVELLPQCTEAVLAAYGPTSYPGT